MGVGSLFNKIETEMEKVKSYFIHIMLLSIIIVLILRNGTANVLDSPIQFIGYLGMLLGFFVLIVVFLGFLLIAFFKILEGVMKISYEKSVLRNFCRFIFIAFFYFFFSALIANALFLNLPSINSQLINTDMTLMTVVVLASLLFLRLSHFFEGMANFSQQILGLFFGIFAIGIIEALRNEGQFFKFAFNQDLNNLVFIVLAIDLVLSLFLSKNQKLAPIASAENSINLKSKQSIFGSIFLKTGSRIIYEKALIFCGLFIVVVVASVTVLGIPLETIYEGLPSNFISAIVLGFVFFYLFDSQKEIDFVEKRTFFSKMINKECEGAYTDVHMFVGPITVIAFGDEPSREEILSKFDEQHSRLLQEIDTNSIIKISEEYEDPLLAGSAGTIFLLRSQKFFNILTLFHDIISAKNFEPLLNISDNFDRVDRTINLYNRKYFTKDQAIGEINRLFKSILLDIKELKKINMDKKNGSEYAN
ncbi:MAG: hypothetical protein AABY04_01380 [Candidatus Micrarchaeota archaeon]